MFPVTLLLPALLCATQPIKPRAILRTIHWLPTSQVLPFTQTDAGVLLWGPGLPVVMGIRSKNWAEAGNELPWDWVVGSEHLPAKTFTYWAKPVPPKRLLGELR